VLKAIAAFTLPLHSNTVFNLDDQDAIYYEFDGDVKVGFGVTYGVSSSVAGYSLSDVFPALKQYGDISRKKFNVSANAGVSMNFNWTRKFSCFLVRVKPDAGPGSAVLHLMTGTSNQRSLELKASGGVTNFSLPKLTVNTDALVQALIKKGTGTPEGQPAPAVPKQVTDAVTAEVSKYVDDANKWLGSLADKIQKNGDVSLSLLFQNSSAYTSAFT